MSVLRDREAVLAALQGTAWIVSEAARALGVSRQGLMQAMVRHGIKKRRTPGRVMTRLLSEAGRRGGKLAGRSRKLVAA